MLLNGHSKLVMKTFSTRETGTAVNIYPGLPLTGFRKTAPVLVDGISSSACQVNQRSLCPGIYAKKCFEMLVNCSGKVKKVSSIPRVCSGKTEVKYEVSAWDPYTQKDIILGVESV